MRPAGYNTSKYTKQDPNDHFGGAFKCLALIIGIIAAIGGLPVGLGLLVAPLPPHPLPTQLSLFSSRSASATPS